MVARRYGELEDAVGPGDSIITIMGLEYGVPYQTVKVWVRTCRRRGMLAQPPGHPNPGRPVAATRLLECGCTWTYSVSPPRVGSLVSCRHHGGQKVMREVRLIAAEGRMGYG
jgi:hypothetical protein